MDNSFRGETAPKTTPHRQDELWQGELRTPCRKGNKTRWLRLLAGPGGVFRGRGQGHLKTPLRHPRTPINIHKHVSPQRYADPFLSEANM